MDLLAHDAIGRARQHGREAHRHDPALPRQRPNRSIRAIQRFLQGPHLRADVHSTRSPTPPALRLGFLILIREDSRDSIDNREYPFTAGAGETVFSLFQALSLRARAAQKSKERPIDATTGGGFVGLLITHQHPLTRSRLFPDI